MSPHLQEAIVGGLIAGAFASIPGLIGLILMIGENRRLRKDYPPHRHENGLIAYPKGYEPPKLEPLEHSWGRP